MYSLLHTCHASLFPGSRRDSPSHIALLTILFLVRADRYGGTYAETQLLLSVCRKVTPPLQKLETLFHPKAFDPL
jgi:hypothetical protein